MITTGFLFAVVRAAMISMIGGLIFWAILRQYKGVSPNTHRLIWFGVLLLGLSIVRLPVDVPYHDAPVIAPVEPQIVQPAEMPTVAVPDESRPMLIPATFAGLPKNHNHNIVPEESTEKTIVETQAASKPVLVPTVLIAGWLGGIAFFLLRRLVSFVRLHLKLRRLTPASVPEWERLLKQFGIAPERIPVLWTENSGPALVRSMFGYRLLFPRALWDELSSVHREGVLRHELAHYLGGDAFVMELARLLATLQWFNPISRVALRRLEEATEWRCDDFAYFNRESGPQELIETLLAVHESTESLGLYLSSFARINVITRINRLLHIPSRKENTLMKKLILPTLFLMLLACSLLQVNLVAKQPVEEKTTSQQSKTAAEPEAVGSPQDDPDIDPEITKLIKLAESMVTQENVTAEQLKDVVEDLIPKTFRDPPVSRDVYKAIIGLCDKIIAMEPEHDMLQWAYDAKLRVLGSQIYYWYSEETIQALKDCASEIADSQHTHLKYYRQEALRRIMSAQIWRLVRTETNTTAEMFLEVQTDLTEYFKATESPEAYLADSFIDVASQLYGRNVITQDQLRQAFETAIKAIRESPKAEEEYPQRILSDLKTKLALMQAEGKTPAITGSVKDGPPFALDVFKGKNVLMAFTSSWYGGREMQDMLELTEEFSGHGLEFVTYVALNGKDNGADENQEEQWLDMSIEKLDYPGTVLTQIESPEPAVQGVVHWLKEQGYRSNHPQFMLVDQNGQIAALGRTGEIREKLVGLFGQPSDEAVARGRERSKVYSTTPKPCVSNLRELALAVHNYYDSNKTMPPAYTIDENGNKLHSWRVLLLPYLGQEALYRQIRLDEPWDSEHNRKVGETIVPVFQCHLTAFGPNPQPVTTYAAVIGRECVFEENGKQVGFIDITDGMSNTILFVERATPVRWMEPTDITFDEAVKGIGVSQNGIADAHNGGCNCAFCDGSTHFLPKDLDLKVLRAILTCSGGESVSFPYE